MEVKWEVLPLRQIADGARRNNEGADRKSRKEKREE